MKITYLDKVAIQNDDSIPDINKVTDADMNEIKKVVNNNEEILMVENERLRADLNGLPKGTAEGENIDLTDSADMRFSSFKISGNSKQEGEPTPDTPIEVKSCGDNITNIFDKNTDIKTGQYIGGDGNISTDTNLFYQDFYIKVEALKQYTISSNITTIYRIAEYDVNKTFIQRYFNGREQTSWTFTVSDNCKYIKIAGTSIQSLDSLKLEKGSTPTPYTAYGQGSMNEIIENEDKTQSQVFTIPTQQPMRSIGDVRDTFVKVNGKWFERHNTDRVIFNGTESWQNVNGYGIFYINNINNLKVNTSDNILTGYLSTHFKEITTTEINAKKEGFCVATVNRLYFFHNGFSSNENLEGFKAWLQEQHNAGTPVYVDYILVTPNDIECTTEQIAKLNELNSTAKTYKGTTHFYSTDNVGANKEVRYFKDIEIMMNK